MRALCGFAAVVCWLASSLAIAGDGVIEINQAAALKPTYGEAGGRVDARSEIGSGGAAARASARWNCDGG